MSYPLSKTLDPERDYAELAPELKHVDPAFGLAAPQHEHRRFEYAMALRAFRVWGETSREAHPICYDVGGAGSPFTWMMPCSVTVIDPNATGTPAYTLEEFVAAHPKLASCVFCLSVLEHVDDLDRFLYHLGCLVAPGGLLFLTFDACDHERHPLDVDDPHHFSWMRKRIFYTGDRRDETAIRYTRDTDWKGVYAALIEREFQPLGEPDWTYHGPQVYDYTFASLALVKRA